MKAAGFPRRGFCRSFARSAQEAGARSAATGGQRQRGHRDRLAGGPAPAVRRFLVVSASVRFDEKPVCSTLIRFLESPDGSARSRGSNPKPKPASAAQVLARFRLVTTVLVAACR